MRACGRGAAAEHVPVVGHVWAGCDEAGGRWAAPDQAEAEKQLAEELSERGAPKSERKRALQLRLRALIIAAVVETDS